MKGERAEIRRVAIRWPHNNWWVGENKYRYYTLRFNTHAEAIVALANEQLQLGDKQNVPNAPFGFDDWKLYELKLISWDGDGNQIIERRSLE